MSAPASAAAAEPLRILRATADRLRISLTAWDGTGAEEIQRKLGSVAGVKAVSVRASTGNALIEFDAAVVSQGTLMKRLTAALRLQVAPPAAARHGEATTTGGGERAEPDVTGSRRPRASDWISGVLREQAGRFGRARIAVRGIDRDPQLARRVVAILEARPEVKRAVASATTGRVLVEFSERITSLQDLLAEISKVELPEVPGEDRPTHPLDPRPIMDSGARAVGAGLGLGLIAVEKLAGVGPGAWAAGSATVAGTLGLIDGNPPLRDAVRARLGRDRAQLVLEGAAVVSLTLSGSPLGLLVSGAGALRIFTEARMRREAWREYEQRLEHVPEAQPGAVISLEAGARVPLRATVIEGVGTVIGGDGLPDGARPGSVLEAGATILRGPLVVELQTGSGFEPRARPREPRLDLAQRYIAMLGPASLAYAGLYALRRRSFAAAFNGLLLVNPRAAVIGSDFADTSASARILRAGVTVVGTRPDRQIRRPDVLLIESPRTLTDGLEQARVLPVGGRDRAEVTELVAAITAASESPWGPGPQPGRAVNAQQGRFDGFGVSAVIAGRPLRLEPAREHEQDIPEVRRAIEAGEQALVLRDERSKEPLAYVHLRPRLAAGIEELRRSADRHGVELSLLEHEDRRASTMLARRAGIELIVEADLVELVRMRQRGGDRVAVLSDSPRAAEAFEACDLAIALTSGRSSRFQARADLLAPGLPAVTAILEAGARRERAAERSVALSVAANIAGATWGLQREVGVIRASYATYAGALAAMGAGWQQLRGGRRSRSVISRLTDPRPERWGRMEVERVLAAMDSRERGLRDAEAQARIESRVVAGRRNALVRAIGEQLESPLIAVLGAGAAVSLAVGAIADVAMIGGVIVANAAVGAWQQRQAGRAAEALGQIGAARARVLRDGTVRELPAEQVVRGDIMLLQSGDRVVADARLIESEALELDESALTGESLPVAKAPDAEARAARIVLEGSDVTVGAARAVVVAVGRQTRLGATAAALSVEDTRTSPLGERLDHLFRQGMPVVLAGGLLVTLGGILWGGAPLAQLALGASVAVAAVPESLPLLAGVAEASVARRLAGQQAYVRRLSAVEALGRVDVVCSDKTGTLTRGRLEVTVLDDLAERVAMADGPLPPSARELLLCASLAGPAPDAAEAAAHATDGAVLAAARRAGLEERLYETRTDEVPFDPVRSLHATRVRERVCVKGAAEVVTPRCSYALTANGSRRELDEPARAELLARAEDLAARGLRVLMVADGPVDSDVEDPSGLTARGYVGISDPPRPGAAEALRRCSDAGVRVIMLTGDHPATAREIAFQLGLPLENGSVLTGEQIENVDAEELRDMLDQASVVARITPIDKLRIVESLRDAGHTVAMTGDGVNDAPALRLADVGVAMGAGGTEVARQAADLVLGDDRFETLADALLEGRSLWQNLHGALGLLLGGNLGEVAMMVGAAVVGRGAVLGARQILAINLVTDVLPAVAVAVQPPRERDLQRIAREGTESFDQRLRQAILRRGAATALPALAAVLSAPLLGAQAPVVAFGSIIVTQLAQTLRSDELQIGTSRPVAGAVAASGGVLAASLALPPLRNFLALPPVRLSSIILILAAAPSSLVIAKALRRWPSSALEKLAGGSVTVVGEMWHTSGADFGAAAHRVATHTPSAVS